MAPPGSTLAPAARTSPAPHPTPSPSPSLQLSPSLPSPRVAPGGGPGLSHARGGCALARAGRAGHQNARADAHISNPTKRLYPIHKTSTAHHLPSCVATSVRAHGPAIRRASWAPRETRLTSHAHTTKPKTNPKIKTVKRNLNRRSVRRGRSPHPCASNRRCGSGLMMGEPASSRGSRSAPRVGTRGVAVCSGFVGLVRRWGWEVRWRRLSAGAAESARRRALLRAATP